MTHAITERIGPRSGPRGPRLAVLAVWLFALLGWSCPALGGETLVVALSELAPWKMVLDGEPQGIDVDILSEAAARMGLGLEFRVASFSRCLKDMKAGKADLMTGLLRLPERESWLVYVTPPYVTETASAFYSTRSRAPTIVRYEYLRGLRIGVKRGEKHFPQFDYDRELRKAEVRDLDDGFRRLLAGQVQAVAAEEFQADWWLAAHHRTAEHVAKTPLRYQGYQPMFCAFSAKSPKSALAAELGATLASMISDGFVGRVLARYAVGR
ncbi:substrate-binding periplasmic protein [Desulfocurvus sp. DL9XJH121]